METKGGGITSIRYIGILGYDILDLTVYLSMVLKNLQYSIIVADMRRGEELLFFQQDSCIYSYKGIEFYRCKEDGDGLKSIPADALRDSDIVIVMGEKDNRAFEDLCDHIYVVADTSYRMSQDLKDIIRKGRKITGVIFRDVTDNGIDASYIIKHIIKDDYLFKILKAGNIYEIEDDIIDREYKIAMSYEGFTDFKNLSEDFLKVISDLTEKITDRRGKILEKALAKAKEGKIIEHSILE